MIGGANHPDPLLQRRGHPTPDHTGLPDAVPGVDEIEYLAVDDGCSGCTSEVAREMGVHHIVRFKQNQGLAYAFSAGIGRDSSKEKALESSPP